MRLLRAIPRLPRLTLSTLVLLSLGGLGCNPPTTTPGGDGGTPDSGTMTGDTTAPTNVLITGGVTADETVSGTRVLTAEAQDDSGSVAKIEFFVDANTLACADTGAKGSGSAFSCSWNTSSLPQGTHQIIARASDAAGNSADSPAITFKIPAPNRTPAIEKVLATPSTVAEAKSVSLSVTANDPDGDALTYSWSQVTPATPEGSFSTGTGSSRTWTAPMVRANTTFTLKVTVKDSKGAMTEATTDVQVTNDPALNKKPVVDPLTPPTGLVVAGDSVDLTAKATDADGDPLTYTWTASATGGVFTGETTSAAKWRSGDLGVAKTYTFTVAVSDGTDTTTRSMDVTVAVPQYARDIQGIWDANCVSCHSSATGSGKLTLVKGSSYAALIDVAGAGSRCSTSTYVRVKRDQPDMSLLVFKLTSTPTCGSRMPLSNQTYFDTNPGLITRVRSWIIAGADNN